MSAAYLLFLHHIDSDCTSCNEFECTSTILTENSMYIQWECLQLLPQGKTAAWCCIIIIEAWSGHKPLDSSEDVQWTFGDKGTMEGSMISVKLWYLKHTLICEIKKVLTSGSLPSDFSYRKQRCQGRMWQILTSFIWVFQVEVQMQAQCNCSWANVFCQGVRYTLYSLWQSRN